MDKSAPISDQADGINCCQCGVLAMLLPAAAATSCAMSWADSLRASGCCSAPAAQLAWCRLPSRLQYCTVCFNHCYCCMVWDLAWTPV